MEGGADPHLQLVVILVGILIHSNSTSSREVIVAVEEGIVIRTWVEPGFEPVIIIIVVIAIIVILRLLLL